MVDRGASRLGARVTLFVGIDCGLHGAVAHLDPSGQHGGARDMPLDDGELDYVRMGDLLGELFEADHDLRVVIEEIAPMPHRVAGVPVGRGSIAAVKLGASYGAWRREIARLGLTPTCYAPARWKAIMLGGIPRQPGEQKRVAVEHACRLFPGAAKLFRGPRGGLLDGRAEAMLLAELARRTWRLTGRA